MGPVWTSLVDRYAAGSLDRRVLTAGARIAAGNPPVATAATSRRRLSGGLMPAEAWPAFEFGADRNKRTTYRRKGATVTRRTRRQLPSRNPRGRVVFKAFREIAPRNVSLWVQIIVKTYNDAAKGK